MSRCDCLNDCGDDPDLRKGKAEPCEHLAKWLARPRVVGVSKIADSEPYADRALLVHFDRPIGDGDLRAVHECLRLRFAP